MARRLLVLALAGILAAATLLAASAGAEARRQPLQGLGEGLELIANIPYTGGTDMEFLTIKGRDYAFAGQWQSGSTPGALHAIDITDPEHPKEVATLGCSMSQADIQIAADKKTLIMAADRSGGPESCLIVGKAGFMTVDISNPRRPVPLGVAEIPRGSHNTTAHPTKPYVYNSDSELTPAGEIQIWSIKNPAKPKLVNTIPSMPHSPHDIGFNKDGTRAVTAAISHFDIFDTSDPENPELLFTGQCPGCSITHDAKFTPDETHVVIGDEGGGGAPYPCPGGALYFYELQGTKQQPVPVLTSMFEPQELLIARGQSGLGGCTSHVFDISDDGKQISISWYTAGTHYLDVSNPVGLTVGSLGVGVKELGWFIPENADSWSSKMYKGPYIYSNDLNRGFDVYKITAERP
ncbi:MAG: LVIVD repeat-containing protein [Actinomycetota bacterium]